ncbi:hypothetical protein D049_0043A, partial [Vibrio parahaemolyticus VPTS-2010]
MHNTAESAITRRIFR